MNMNFGSGNNNAQLEQIANEKVNKSTTQLNGTTTPAIYVKQQHATLLYGQSAVYVENTAGGIGAEIKNSSSGYGLAIVNTSTGIAEQISNQGNGSGINISNSGGGFGIYVNHTGSGYGAYFNAGIAASGATVRVLV